MADNAPEIQYPAIQPVVDDPIAVQPPGQPQAPAEQQHGEQLQAAAGGQQQDAQIGELEVIMFSAFWAVCYVLNVFLFARLMGYLCTCSVMCFSPCHCCSFPGGLGRT